MSVYREPLHLYLWLQGMKAPCYVLISRGKCFSTLVFYIYFKSSIVYLTELSVGPECIFRAGAQLALAGE